MSIDQPQGELLDTRHVKSNRVIDSFIANGAEFAIDKEWALQELSNYLHELEALESGVDFTALGMYTRRAAHRPGVITVLNGQPKIINDPAVLKNEDMTPTGSFALLRLQGVMRGQDGISTQGITSLVDQMRMASMNDNIEGILIEANTGGGEVTAGQMLMSAIEQSPKAVVVYAHMLASGGIMGTLPADEIIASGKQARFGSIGTYITIDKTVREWYSRYYEDIYADKSTNKNADWRAYLRGDNGPIQQMVNKTNDIFLDQVKAYRTLRGNVEDTLSGSMFFADEAKRRGLVDGIGSFDYAVKRLAANVRRRKE